MGQAGLGGIALLWAVWQLLIREAVDPTASAGGCFLAAAGILSLATLKAPGLAPASLILLLGFGNGNRVLSGLGVAALLGYLSFYYYNERAKFTTNAFFFQEGDVKLYDPARYGEFRTGANGDAILTGLRGRDLVPLGGRERP